MNKTTKKKETAKVKFTPLKDAREKCTNCEEPTNPAELKSHDGYCEECHYQCYYAEEEV